jgi:hypothetical protein
MSLSDYMKYLRALRGGATPWEISEECGVPAGHIHLIEVKHRRVGEDDETLQKLAHYFEVPVEELLRRREAYRKRLSFFLEEARQKSGPVLLRLESGEELEGAVAWYSREAVALSPVSDESNATSDGDSPSGAPLIVQRAWVADWRRSDSPQWEVAGG